MEYKRLILEMMEKISNTDTIFLRQIYTLIKRHVERVGNCVNDQEP